ncbi:MAG: putative RNA uridine N3 methyltransferase [Candidatus Asgardarchaeia archaeon]
MKYPPKNNFSLSIAIPSSFTSQVHHPLLRTYMVSQIARAASIFRVENIVVFLSSKNKVQKQYQREIYLILKYLITPQYLRRKVFPKTKLLRYAGILPPLQTPNHPTYEKLATIKEEFREGLVVDETKTSYIVDVGLDKMVHVRKTEKASIGDLVLVHLKRVHGKLLCNLTDYMDVDFYLRYNVLLVNNTLRRLLRDYKEKNFVIIGTSKLGNPYYTVVSDIKKKTLKHSQFLIVFGGPKEGLLDLGSNPNDYDFFINVVPNQGVRVIRTEEAVLITLSLLNDILSVR